MEKLVQRLVHDELMFRKKLAVRHIPGPQGVRGRNSDNRLIKEKLDWEPNYPLREGIKHTYHWINGQVEQAKLGT